MVFELASLEGPDKKAWCFSYRGQVLDSSTAKQVWVSIRALFLFFHRHRAQVRKLQPAGVDLAAAEQQRAPRGCDLMARHEGAHSSWAAIPTLTFSPPLAGDQKRVPACAHNSDGSAIARFH